MSVIKIASTDYTDNNFLAAKKNEDGSYNVKGEVVFEKDITTPAGDFATKADLAGKQDNLTAGNGIKLNGSSISVNTASSVGTSNLPVTASAVNSKLANYVNTVTSPDGSITISKSGSNLSLKANRGGGGGSWYEYNEPAGFLNIGPGYGDTPSEADYLSLGVKKQGKGNVDIGSNVYINTYEPGSYVWISGDTQWGYVYIGPSPGTGIQVNHDGETHFNCSVYDKNNNEILGSGGGTWYEHESYSEVFIGPGYGDTPSDTYNFVLGRKDSNSKIEMGASMLLSSEGDMIMRSHCTIYIGPSSTSGIEVRADGETHFNCSVYDKNNNEILGGGGGGSELKAKTWFCTFLDKEVEAGCGFNNLSEIEQPAVENHRVYNMPDAPLATAIIKFKEAKSMAEVNNWLMHDFIVDTISRVNVIGYGFPYFRPIAVCVMSDNSDEWPEAN